MVRDASLDCHCVISYKAKYGVWCRVIDADVIDCCPDEGAIPVRAQDVALAAFT